MDILCINRVAAFMTKKKKEIYYDHRNHLFTKMIPKCVSGEES